MSLVKIDLSKWAAPSVENLAAVVPGILQDLATAARAKWVLLAQQRLRTSGQDYIRGIQMPIYTEREATIELLGMLPNMVEQGWSGGNMRDGLLGPHARGRKRSRAGYYYNVVPFRRTVPGTAGRAGIVMGAEYGAQAASVGRRIYKELQALAPGASLGEHPELKLRAYHAADPFARMRRAEARYERATQAHYVTFRTISNNPRSVRVATGGTAGKASANWIHPGISPMGLADEVAAFVEAQAPVIVAAALRD